VHDKPMAEEVCCLNFIMLFGYLENAQGLSGGLSGQDAVFAVIRDIVDDPRYLIRNPNNREIIQPVAESHLRNKKCWVSQELAYKIFAKSAEIIGGYRPLYHAGLYSAYMWLISIQPKHFQILRFLTMKLMSFLCSFVSHRANRISTHHTIVFRKGYAEVGRRYTEPYHRKLTKDVCDWNVGIYAGFGTYLGAYDFKIEEKACILDGDLECISAFTWKHHAFLRKLFIFFHCMVDPDYVKDRDLDNLLLHDLVMRQDGIIAQKTADQLKIQEELAAASQKLLEQRITGGFAHEMRNAIAGAQLEIQSIRDYKNSQQSAPRTIHRVAVTLLKEMDRLYDQYHIPRKEIARRFIPTIKDLAAIADDLDETLTGVELDLRRSMEITTQIRDYAKLAELKAGSDRLDLAHLLKEVLAKHRKAHADVDFIFERDTKKAVFIRGAEMHMNSIFNNLILNAIEAFEDHSTDRREVKVGLRHDRQKTDTQIVVEICDNGPGIEEDHLKEIFEPFFSTKQPSGTGLGLGIVDKMVDLYDGSIQVASISGSGTKAVVVLPSDEKEDQTAELQ
jgi:signal transduction histidine kinase